MKNWPKRVFLGLRGYLNGPKYHIIMCYARVKYFIVNIFVPKQKQKTGPTNAGMVQNMSKTQKIFSILKALMSQFCIFTPLCRFKAGEEGWSESRRTLLPLALPAKHCHHGHTDCSVFISGFIKQSPLFSYDST